MSILGQELVKLSGKLRVLDLGADRPQPSQRKVDRSFEQLSSITTKQAMLQELEALGAVGAGFGAKVAAISDQQAEQSLGRLDALEQSKPTWGQVGRYGAVGAIGAPIADVAHNVVKGGPVFGGGLRGAAAKAVAGAVTGGALPLLRNHMDRKAEIGTLRKYMGQQGAPNA